MKKLHLFFCAGLFCLLLSFKASAQATGPTDYFVGKWNVIVEGTPQGNGKMTITLERENSKLNGTIITREGTATTKFSKVEEKEKSVTVFYTTNGYDVYLLMEKKDDDNVTGNMMDMYDARGVRVKDTVVKQ